MFSTRFLVPDCIPAGALIRESSPRFLVPDCIPAGALIRESSPAMDCIRIVTDVIIFKITLDSEPFYDLKMKATRKKLYAMTKRMERQTFWSSQIFENNFFVTQIFAKTIHNLSLFLTNKVIKKHPVLYPNFQCNQTKDRN